MALPPTPRERVAAALVEQQAGRRAPEPLPEPLPVSRLPAVPIPLAERPTKASVKPFAKLPLPAQELVRSGGEAVGTATLTQRPLTRAELEREYASLKREAATIARRQRQISEQLLSLPTTPDLLSAP